MSSKRAYQGVDKLRRLLRKIDPELTDNVRAVIRKGSQGIEFNMLASVPVDEGDLQQSISFKTGRDGFTAYIGPGVDRASITKLGFGMSEQKHTRSGALTKATIANNDARFQLYKAHWIEYGTKPHGGHPGQPARPFMTPAYDANKGWIQADLKNAIKEALEAAGRG